MYVAFCYFVQIIEKLTYFKVIHVKTMWLVRPVLVGVYHGEFSLALVTGFLSRFNYMSKYNLYSVLKMIIN